MRKETSIQLDKDILRGAEEIAEFVFGSRNQRRKIYYLAECTRFPIFRLGSQLCARRSVVMEWIEGQEKGAAKEITEDRRNRDEKPEAQ